MFKHVRFVYSSVSTPLTSLYRYHHSQANTGHVFMLVPDLKILIGCLLSSGAQRHGHSMDFILISDQDVDVY